MRTNLPVTGKEIILDEGLTIVSKTDLKGRITYVNQTFVDVSGFTAEELVGQSHNIVRHPDMPVEVFADLWKHLKQGRPWSGYFKNRCKNGDHYWVRANQTPIFEGGQVSGYLSVRERPARDQVAVAEAAYAKLRAGGSGLVVVEGQVLPDYKIKLALRKVTVAQRLMVTLLVLVAMLVIQGLSSLGELKDMEHGVKALYEEHVAEIDNLKTVADLYAVNIVDAAHKARNGNISYNEALKSVTDAHKRIGESWGRFSKADHPPEERVIVDKVTLTIGTADTAVAELVAILKAKDGASLATFTINRLYPAIDPVSDQVGAMIAAILQGAKEEYEEAETTYAQSVKMTITFIIGAVVLAVLLGVAMLRAVRRPVDSASEYFRKFAEGRLDFDVTITQRDEMSTILDSAKAMQVKLGFDMAEARRQANEMTRVKIALDNVSTGVMIADPQRNIIYVNTAVQRLLKDAEGAIRSQLPGFRADRLIGQCIDQFHKHPAHQEGMLARLSAAHTARFEMGGRHMVVTASPVRNERNERLGTVAEWVDRTGEALIEKEVGDIVAAAGKGELSARLDMQGKTGFYAQLSSGLNQLLDTTQNSLETTSVVLGRVAQGDLSQTVDASFTGIFGQLKDDTNATIHKLRDVIGQIQEASEAINTAANEIASGNSDLSSRTEEQASSLEETSSSMEQLNATVKQNAENAGKANELSKRSNEAATRGGEMVRHVVDTMSGIQESSKKIADIIGVIDSIAFQTNILALNAAVEAARAGEQGRGFAVVATEVRNLAQRSATAAKEIKELIAESVAKVDGGARLVGDAGRSMDDVVQSFSHLATLVTEISNASREQSAGIEQVTQAVSQMDEVTQQNAALVEEAAAAAESLEEQARTLVQAVAMFQLSAGAAGATPRHNAPAALGSPKPGSRAARKKPEPVKAVPKRLPAAIPADDGEAWSEF